jgi:glycosyltransferase involved in cell wall biosynthesis
MQPDSKPLVSVIIPTYNRAALVPLAIDSVLQQTFSDRELIVVDDASTDDTAERLQDSYGETIRYIKKTSNAGPSATRNTGMQMAHGRYIAFLDDDDEWLPEKLALQVPLMQQHPAVGMVYCGCLLVDEKGASVGQIKPEKRGYIFNDLLHKNYLITSSALIRKELLEKTGGFDETLAACEDWDLWMRVSQQCLIEYIDEPLLRYKAHKHNIHHDMYKMEKNTFRVFDKCLSAIDITSRNRIYGEQSTWWAWEYYTAGKRDDFARLLCQALACIPLGTNLFNFAGNWVARERDFFAVLHDFWSRPENSRLAALKKKSYAQQLKQIAWEYYRCGDLPGFRQRLRKAIAWSLPDIPLRLLIAYVKSFLST